MDNNNQNVFYNPPGSTPAPTPVTILQSKEIKPMQKKDTLFILLFLIAAFIFIDFAVLNGFNLGFTISYFIIFILATAYLFKKDVKVSPFTYACGGLSLIGSVTLSLYSDGLINSIMVFLIGGLFTAYCCGLSSTFRHKQGSFKILFDMLASAFITPFSNLSDVSQAFKGSMKANKKVLNALIGIAVSIPVLLVIVPLLASSDAAFEGLITSVLKNIGKYLIEIALAVLVTPYIVSFMYSKKEKVNFKPISKNADNRTIPASASISFLCVISVTYVVYLFSQLAYFFSAFSGILPSDYKNTASAFARRGFFEMFAICVINIIILSIAGALTKRKENGKASAFVKALSCFISLFSIVLIVTAMAKMKLNIDIYGLSKNRLLVSVFMIMLFIIIVFFIIHIFAPKVSYMQPIIVICSAIFIALSFADIDAVVAKYNVEAHKSGKIETIDVEYLSLLSDSAVPYIAELADDSELKADVRYDLCDKIEYEFSDYLNVTDDNKIEYIDRNDFRKYNMSTYKACEVLFDYYNSLTDEEREDAFSYYDDWEESEGEI